MRWLVVILVVSGAAAEYSVFDLPAANDRPVIDGFGRMDDSKMFAFPLFKQWLSRVYLIRMVYFACAHCLASFANHPQSKHVQTMILPGRFNTACFIQRSQTLAAMTFS